MPCHALSPPGKGEASWDVWDWFYQCMSGPCHPNATHFLGVPFAMDGSISAGCHPSAHRDHSSRDLFRTLCQTSLLILCPLFILAARYPAPLPKWYQCTRPGFGPATQWLPFSNPSPASSVLPSWSPCCLPNIRAQLHLKGSLVPQPEQRPTPLMFASLHCPLMPSLLPPSPPTQQPYHSLPFLGRVSFRKSLKT